MSEENVEIVRGCLSAYLSGNNEAALAALDPEIEFDQTIRPDGQVFHGPQGVAEAMRAWVGEFDDWSLEVDEFIDADDRVLVIGRQTGRGKISGIETEQQFSHLVTVRDGKVVHWKAYLNREQALQAAGLSE